MINSKGDQNMKMSRFITQKDINKIEKQIKSETDPTRIECLQSVKNRLQLWKKMEDGDMDALVELSIESGLMNEEDRKFFKESSDE